MTQPALTSKTSEIILSWFYCGRLPCMPGTWGSLGAFPFIYYCKSLGSLALLAFIISMLLLGYHFAKEHLIKHSEDADPSWIVIDEVVGQAIPFLYIQWSWQNAVLAFVLFRLFDIWKPGPIGWADKLKGSPAKNAISIILDDILAGIMALIISRLLTF